MYKEISNRFKFLFIYFEFSAVCCTEVLEPEAFSNLFGHSFISLLFSVSLIITLSVPPPHEEHYAGPSVIRPG